MLTHTATCCTVDDEYVKDDVVRVHGDDSLAVQGVAESSERHDLVEPFAEFLMQRKLKNPTSGRMCKAIHAHSRPRCAGSPRRRRRPNLSRWCDCAQS